MIDHNDCTVDTLFSELYFSIVLVFCKAYDFE